MGRRGVRPGVAVVVLALVAVGCGSGSGGSGDVETIDGAPVVSSGITRAGGELPNGFSVPSGTVLLGAVERTGVRATVNGVAVPERGWRALMLVTGDPYDVLDEVRAQATRAGLPGAFMSTACDTNPAGQFECQLDGRSSGELDEPGRVSWTGRLVRGRAEADRPPMSHLLLRYSEVQPAADRAALPAPQAVDRTVPAPPFPDDWPPLLRPGDRFGSIPGEQWTVEPGARLVAPPSYTAVCGTGGFDAVFELTGDPRQVVDAYARQFAAAEFSPMRAPFGDDVPGTGPSARSTQPGGGDVSAVTVVGPDDRRFLWLSRCND